jgi:hypothetical protein
METMQKYSQSQALEIIPEEEIFYRIFSGNYTTGVMNMHHENIHGT